MKIIKRNGQEADFDRLKIKVAILSANKDVSDVDKMSDDLADVVSLRIEDYVRRHGLRPSVEDIQDLVEVRLMEMGYHKLAQEYIKYRYQRELLRKGNSTDEKILSLIGLKNKEILEENSNKNPIINSTQRDYMAGEVSRDLSRRFLLTPEIRNFHDSGIGHVHDTDYLINRMTNCCLINLEDMLKNGTAIGEVKIDTPRSFYTACNIACQIICSVTSSQWGGTSITLSHLAPYVDVSRQSYIKEVRDEMSKYNLSENEINEIAEKRLLKEIERGVQTIQYQVLTMSSTNGQSPFISVFMYLNEIQNQRTKDDLALIIEEVLKQRIKGVKNKAGVWTSPSFPKLIYVLEEDNITEDSKYWNLTKLSAFCSSQRMVPDYISEKKMKELKDGNCFPVMGCRSALSSWKDENGNYKFYGRFNFGVITLNLVDVACSSGKNFDLFWKLLEERAEICHKFLLSRYEYMKDTPSDVAPILWQNGALARLKPGEKIGKLLTGGYATASLGYAGLWETVYYMLDKEMTTPEGEALGLEIMQRLNKLTEKWKAVDNIGYGIYGTPKQPWVA